MLKNIDRFGSWGHLVKKNFFNSKCTEMKIFGTLTDLFGNIYPVL